MRFHLLLLGSVGLALLATTVSGEDFGSDASEETMATLLDNTAGGSSKDSIMAAIGEANGGGAGVTDTTRSSDPMGNLLSGIHGTDPSSPTASLDTSDTGVSSGNLLSTSMENEVPSINLNEGLLDSSLDSSSATLTSSALKATPTATIRKCKTKCNGQTYNHSTHHCVNNTLCAIKDDACSGICYDPVNYSCVNNMIVQKGMAGARAISSNPFGTTI
ncbi:hypothetical protein IWQ60_002722 [Tieghemiomyces parasiticus]|uniref:Endo-1,3(4)-beta-glucanase 1 carbohydrate binding domain-containing protein n=1 Tax=Tieghemiomyces parasiticus TaxID=78921 RepID=A0A9W8DX47_9FUNG|nr:hypothetical protein IWQ60_002722 [Tieghemiomyces parasiticus]